MIKIETKNLSYSYHKGEKILLDISFKISDATVTVLLGLNGSGKTTLIRNLTGILKPSEGTVFIGNEDISRISPLTLSKLVAYVPQNIFEDTDFSVADYLTFGRMNTIKFYAAPKTEDYQMVKKIASELGIDALLGKKINELSGGQRQLVTIARAVVQNSDIIIMDEPTSSIDYKFLDVIIRYIDKLKRQGKTIVLSCHSPSIPLLLDADLIVLKNGHINRSGKARKILTKKALKEIYGCDFINCSQLPYEEASLIPIENEIRSDNI